MVLPVAIISVPESGYCVQLVDKLCPAAILLMLLPPLRCDLQSDALPAAILLRLLFMTGLRVDSAPNR